MDEEIMQTGTEQEQGPKIKVSDYANKFKAAEKSMKQDFLPKYNLAKTRLRSEHLVSGRGTKKYTHEQVNLVYSIGVNFVNSVYFKNPNCNLTAREQVDHAQVENTEIKVNDWLPDAKVKRVVKRSVWDAYLGGFGAVITDSEYDDMEDPSNVLEPGSEAVVDPVSGQEISPAIPPKFGKIVLKNKINIQRIRPDLIRVPDGFDMDNSNDSPWIGFEVIHPIDEVKKNEKWDQSIRVKIEGKKFRSLSTNDEKSNQGEGNELYAKIGYCFIKSEGEEDSYKLLIFSPDNTDAPLYFDDFDKGHTGCPIKFIYFNPLDDENAFPCGDPWIFESQLNAVDTWWKSIVRHVKRSNPKTVYDMGVVDTNEVGKLKSNDDNAFVGIKNKQQRNLNDLFKELNAPISHPDLDKLWSIARELLGEISPKTNLSRGAKDKDVNTATEAKIMNAGEMIDMDARIDDTKDFITSIVLDVAGQLENIAAPMTVRRELDDGTELFDEVGAEGFTSKVKIDVDVESMQAQNKDVVRRHLIEAMELVGKLKDIIAASGKQPDPIWWFERLLETMNIRNIDKAFIDIQPMIDPVTGQPIVPGQSPIGAPPMGPPAPGPVNPPSGEMPPEAIEAGLAQRI